MRYEHIELDISTAGCAALLEHLSQCCFPIDKYGQRADDELTNLKNELRARLQRRDVDVHCPKNLPATGDWLNE